MDEMATASEKIDALNMHKQHSAERFEFRLEERKNEEKKFKTNFKMKI